MNATERYWWLERQIAAALGTIAAIQQDVEGWAEERRELEESGAVDLETISMWAGCE